MRQISTASLLLFASLFIFTAPASSADPVQLPPGPAGQRVADYFKAFNSGDDQSMLKFFETNVAPEALKRRPADQRLQIYHNMHSRMQSLELRKILSTCDSSIITLAQTKSGDWFRITFMLDAGPAHMLIALGVEDTEPPSENQPNEPLTQSQAVAELEKYIDSLVAIDQFSGTVLLAKDGAPYFSRACGLASKEYNVPNRLDTKFNLGSINKIFTNIAIRQLAQQGKLSFDDPLGKWLPDYPNKDAREKVTIRHLLTMSSGIGDFFGEKFDATPKDRLRTIADYLPLFDEQPLLFEPGTKEQYSNGGYIVLGAIIEKVSGQSYYAYVRDHIFVPAGMTSTDSYESDIPALNLAQGYTTEHSGAGVAEGTRINNIYTRPARGSSAGGGYSTVEDLLKFVLALQDHKLITPSATRWLLDREYNDGTGELASATPPENHGGMGVAGGAPGLNAMLDFDYTTGYTSIVMSNYDPPCAERVGKRIRNMLSRVK
jgi:D-alanyl-D-alanine carboxypeptidase